MRVGTRVRLKGLVGAAEHNGKCGSVVGYQRERIKVKLLNEDKILALKEANLTKEEVVVGEDEETRSAPSTATTPEEKQQLEEEEEEVCPLCLETLIPERLDFGHSKSVRFTCCGKILCTSCASQAEDRLECCPLCRRACATTPEENLANIREHANRGQAWAATNLGQVYMMGDGVPQNDKLAFTWFRKAADKHIPARHAVGQCYETGKGVKQSDAKAFDWYRKGANAGYALSQFRCGKMYLTGRGVAQDLTEGIRLVRLAAEQGFDAAQAELGLCYDNGIGVEPSPRSAISWYLKAAKQNKASAQHDLALCLIKLGRSTYQMPPPAAFYLVRKANAQAFPESADLLAHLEKVSSLACGNCGTLGKCTKRCSRCRTRSYCSAECQRIHWKRGGHNKLCCDKDTDIADFELSVDDYISKK